MVESFPEEVPMPPLGSQKIPESPREAIQLMREELNKLEGAPWVRNYQAGATMSTGTAVAPQAGAAIQTIGLGFTSLAVFAVETAVGQGAQRS
jgi:hypothetical protein